MYLRVNVRQDKIYLYHCRAFREAGKPRSEQQLAWCLDNSPGSVEPGSVHYTHLHMSELVQEKGLEVSNKSLKSVRATLESKCVFCQAEKAIQERIDRATADLRRQLEEVTAERDRLAALVKRRGRG